MKKMRVFVLAFLLVMSLCGISSADEWKHFTSGEWEYYLHPGGGAVIDKYTGMESRVAIPDELDGHRVISISKGTFYDDYFNLVSVSIPDNVTSVLENPFDDCVNLTDIMVSPDNEFLEVVD